jgi:CRISPR-associated endonuclease Cas2
MPRPKKVEISLKEKLLLIKAAGLMAEQETIDKTDVFPDGIQPLNERIRKILNIVQSSPMKATEMLFLVMYDIENNKVRTLIAQYLLDKGCIRIQKSVYFARTKPVIFREICQTLKEVQEAYENVDSIVIVPVHAQATGSMRIIGKDIQIDSLIDPPNTVFF